MAAPVTTVWVQDVIAVLEFLFSHFWKLFALTFLIVFRKGLASVVGRLVKGNLSVHGVGEGGFEASPLVVVPPVQQEPAPKTEPPGEVKPAELERPDTVEATPEAECPSFSDVYTALRERRVEDAERMFRAYFATLESAEQKYSDESFYLYLLFSDAGKQDAVDRLAALHAGATTDEKLEASTSYLASCYSLMKDYEKEERVWTDAIAKANSERTKTIFISGLASLYDKKGSTDQGIALLQDRLRAVSDKEQKSRLYVSLSNLHKKKGEAELAALAAEKAVEFDPGDHDKLFTAAYQQSEQKIQLLAATNYRTLLGLDRKHSSAKNNLAVCAAALKVPGKKIQLYKEAANEGVTLAMANLATEKMDVGLFDEAQAILDEARVMDSPHENVGNAIYRLEKARKDDLERWVELGKKGVVFQRKVRQYAEALFERTAPEGKWEGTWYTATGEEVTVAVTPDGVAGSWTEIKPGRGLGMLRTASVTIECVITGQIRGRSARVTYSRRDPNEKKPTALFAFSSDSTVSCYSYITDDDQEWYFFETNSESDAAFTLYRKKPGGQA